MIPVKLFNENFEWDPWLYLYVLGKMPECPNQVFADASDK